MLIIIVAHLPIFTLQRHEGRIFAPMAYTVVSALVGSLLFSLTLVPLLALFLLGKAAPTRRTPSCAGASASTSRCCACARAPQRRARRRPSWRSRRACSLVPRLGTEFLPSSTKDRSGSTSCCRRASRCPRRAAALAHPRGAAPVPRGADGRLEVRPARGRHRPQDDQHGGAPRRLEAVRASCRAASRRTQLVEQMNAALQKMPGIEPSFSQPIRDNVLESISQIDGQIVLKVFGDDMTRCGEAARVLRRACRSAASRGRSSTAAARRRSCRSRSTAPARRATA